MRFIMSYQGVIVLVTIMLSGLSFSAAAQVYSCKDKNGVTRYTDKKSTCHAPAAVDVKFDKDTRVNFRHPQRNYIKHTSRFTIFTEYSESKLDHAAFNEATKKLETALQNVFRLLPASSHSFLITVDYYILIGPTSPLGGESAIYRYIKAPSGKVVNLFDARWQNTVVLYNVYDFNKMTDKSRTRLMLHELTHAWHWHKYQTAFSVSKESWLASRSQGLYQSQRHRNGGIVTPGYATTNHREYFAELTTMYFWEANYFPFNRNDLKGYDPKGYEMVERLWGITPY